MITDCGEYSLWLLGTIACLAGFAGFAFGMAVMHFRMDRRNAKQQVR